MQAADSNKAFDAIIAAIGILAALIAIGTYIQLPPGTALPYWAECYYPLFVAYFILNGTALVFAMAAVIAVTLGPYVLIRMRRVAWRRQVVQMGFYHTAFSLCALLAAFACSGLITSGYHAPDFRCARLWCEDGGVPCSPYSVRYTYGSPAGNAANNSSTTESLMSLANIELSLDQTLMSLNRQLFVDSTGKEHQDEAVVCHDYGLVASVGDIDLGGPVNDTLGHPINKTCFALLGGTAFQSSFNGSLGQAHGMDSRTLWCSSSRKTVGPGWLPLTLDTTIAMLGLGADVCRYGYGTSSQNNTVSEYACSAPAPAANVFGSLEPLCPGPAALQSASRPSMSLNVTQHLTLQAYQLLNGSRTMSVVASGSGQSVLPYDDAFMQYARALGGPQAVQLLCESNVAFTGSLCDTGNTSTTSLNNWPLRGAVPYRALRYRCSGAGNMSQPAVLCDHGVHPKFAVDADGKYLSKSGMRLQEHVIMFYNQQFSTTLRLAVFILLALLVTVNFLTFAWLVVGFSFKLFFYNLFHGLCICG